jgi:hypothetical protein
MSALRPPPSGSAAVSASRSGAEVTGGRLPAEVTSFVGRTDELRRLRQLLESSTLVTTVPGAYT